MENNAEAQEPEDFEEYPLTGAEAMRDVFTSKAFLQAIERMFDKSISIKTQALSKNYSLFLWATVLRYVLTGFVALGFFWLFHKKDLSESAALPLLTAIVASLFIPPKSGG